MTKPFFFLLLFLLPIEFIQSQTPFDLLKNADELYQNAEYQKALNTIQTLLNSREGLSPEIEVSSYLLAGNIYLDAGQTEGAANFYSRALSLGQSSLGESDSLTIQAMNNSAECDYRLGNIKKSVARHEWVLKKRVKKYGELHPDVADSYNNLGNGKFALQDLKGAIDFHKTALRIRQKVLKPGHPDLAVSYMNLGNCFLTQNKPGSAISYFKPALENRKKNYPADHPKIGLVYLALGKCSAGQLQKKTSLNYFQKAADIFQKKFQKGHPTLLNYYETIGDVLSERGIYQEALKYYKKILSDNSGENFYSKRQWVIEDKIGICYQHLGDFSDAEKSHETAIKIFEKNFDSNTSGYAELLTNLGNAYLRNNDFEKAYSQYEKANQIYLTGDGLPNPIISNNLGLCALEKEEFDKAAEFFSEAIEFSESKFQYPHFYKNLAVAEKRMANYEAANQVLIFVSDYFNNNKRESLDWLSILIEKAEILKGLGKIEEAEKTYFETDNLAEKLRNQLMDPIAREQFQGAYFHLYKNIVDFYFERWKSTQDEKFLEGAFEASEKSRSLVLLETVQSANSENFQGVPQEILEEEKKVISRINNFSDQDSLTVSPPQFEFEKFLEKIKNEYPEYYRLKYMTEVITSEALRKNINSNQVFCEYFISEKFIYIFVLSHEVFDVIRLEKDFPMNDWMLDFRRANDRYARSSGKELKRAITTYNVRAFSFFEKLIQPVLRKYELPDEWIIVPDGILNYLPFECLLTEDRDSSDRFKTHPYLLQKLKISYVYSGSMLHELMNHKLPSATRNILSVAPDFKNNAFGLSELSFNVPEAEAVSELLEGDVLKNEDATLPEFLSIAGDYRMLLLATHGEANARSGEYSWLAFSYLNDSLNNDLLYAKDLYENPFAASLVVLSACETGIGEYREGEGVLSLARGFFYAGAQTIIPTLWSVDDARNSEIIQSFFKHLNESERVVDALHQAKLDFLKERTHDEAHPVYWAAPIVIGLPEPDISVESNLWIWIFGALFVGAVLFFTIIKYLKSFKE